MAGLLSSLSRLPAKAVVGAVVALLVVAALLSLGGGAETRTASAHFSRAVSVYVGTEVRILGVTIGEVTAVVPEGDSVRVDLAYDAEYQVPADAQAVIVTPTLVADRFIQLTPVYTGGPELADGADIAMDRTGTPVELDRIYDSLAMLSNALGPNGANANGSLDDLLSAGARTLDGRGAVANRMLLDLSRAAETFGNNSGDLFATVEQLDAFTRTLARKDRVVDRFLRDLATASAQLSGERQEIAAALEALARAVGTVKAFVREHRGALTSQVEDLTSVLDVLVKEKDSLGLALEKGALGASNLAVAFDAKSGSIGSRINVDGNVEDLDGFLCAIVRNAGIRSPDAACALFERLLEPLDLQLPRGGSPAMPSTRVIGESVPAEDLQGLLGGGAR